MISSIDYQLHIKTIPQSPSPLCTQCNLDQNETVNHFILKCPQFLQQRTRMFLNLTNIWDSFQDGIGIKLEWILFPYNLKQMDNPNLGLELNHQVNIWKTLLIYIQDTHRFDNSNLYRINITKLS